MTQARTFPLLMNRIDSLPRCEIAINAMTAADPASTDASLERNYAAISVSYSDLELHGASKALFIQVMTALAICGNPEELRIEWAPERFTLDEEAGTVSAHLMVIGHAEFGPERAAAISCPEDIIVELNAAGLMDRGVSSIAAANLPDPQPHGFTTPQETLSLRALFVSLMLAMYDAGGAEKVELYWRTMPKVDSVLDPERVLYTAMAAATFVPKQRIVLA